MAVPEAAPELLVIADLLIGLVFLLTFLFLLALLWTYRHTFGWLFETVAGWSLKVPVVNWRFHPLGILGTIDVAFLEVISAGAVKSQALSGRFFHAAAVVQGWIVRELRDFAVEVWSWATWLQRAHLPRWVKALIYAALPPLLIPAILKRLGHVNVPALYRRLRNLERTLLQRMWRAMVKYGPLAIPGGHAIPGLIRDVRGFRRELADLLKLRRRLAWLFAFTSAAGLVAVGIRALKLGWLRCSNVGKAGKAICRTDARWLENALLGLVAIFGTMSLETLAVQLYAIVGDGAREVAHFWRTDVGIVPTELELGQTGGAQFLGKPAGYHPPNPGLGELG